MELKVIKPHLLTQFKSDRELIQAIDKLSANFTHSRVNINEYLNDEKLVSAYTAFFLLTNFQKLEEVFKLANIDLDNFKDYEFFDIGSGPGTFSLALLALNATMDITLIEKSILMREQAKKLISNIYPLADIKYYNSDFKYPIKKKKRFGLFGHSSNEMGIETTLKYIETLDLDFILFIEPGTKDYFHEALRIRSKLLESYDILYPCLTKLSCPLNPDKDWCHQYLKVSHSVDVERISQMAKKDRRNFPILVHVFSKESLTKELSEGHGRIIRVFKPTKFSLEWQVCMEENKLIDLQIMTRAFSKKEIKELQSIKSGELIKFKIVKSLEENKFRGELI